MDLLVLIAPLLLMLAAGASAHRRCPNFWQASFQGAAISTAMLTVGLLVLYGELIPRPVEMDGLIFVGTLFLGTAFVSWIVALLAGLYFAGYQPFGFCDEKGSGRIIPRFSITQLLMATALVGIVLTFLQTEGQIHYGTYIESIGFLSNGEQLAVAKLNARHPIPTTGLSYRGKFALTVSILQANNGIATPICSESKFSGYGTARLLSNFGKSSIATVSSSNELYILKFGASDEVSIHSIDTDLPARKIAMPDYFMSFTLSPDRSRIGISHFNELAVLDIATAKYIMHKPDWRYSPTLGAVPMSFSDDGALLAAGGYDAMEVLDLANGTRGFVVESEGLPFSLPVQFVPHRSMLAVGVKNGVELYDLQGQLVHHLTFSGPCRAIAASSNGKFVAAAYESGVALFDIDVMEQVWSSNWNDPSCLAFSPDGTQLAVGDFNGLVSLVDVATGDQLWQVSPPSAENWTWTIPYALLGAWSIACIYLAWRKTRANVVRPAVRIVAKASVPGCRDHSGRLT